MPGNRRSCLTQDWNVANNAYSTTVGRNSGGLDGSAYFQGFSVHAAWLMIAACAGLCSLVPVLVRMRSGVRGTSLLPAWRAALLTWAVWTVVAVVTIAMPVPAAGIDCLWYLAAVTGLIPPIATLGARRPIHRVWTWFVLVPLVMVFSWPVMPSVWRGAGHLAAFDLETPLIVGFLLVSVMGAGNYIGLSHTVSAVLWIAGLWLVVLPLCPATSSGMPQALTARAGACFCLVAAGWIADRQVARRERVSDIGRRPLDHVWDDFRELFGIVWSRRIMERFNDEARRNGAPLRLGLHGLETAAGEQPEVNPDAASLATAESSLRWLLQKFVDPGWIERRICGRDVADARGAANERK